MIGSICHCEQFFSKIKDTKSMLYLQLSSSSFNLHVTFFFFFFFFLWLQITSDVSLTNYDCYPVNLLDFFFFCPFKIAAPDHPGLSFVALRLKKLEILVINIQLAPYQIWIKETNFNYLVCYEAVLILSCFSQSYFLSTAELEYSMCVYGSK